MVLTWLTSLFAKPSRADDVAGAGHVNPPDPDVGRNEGSVVQGPCAARGGDGVADGDAPPAQDVKIDINCIYTLCASEITSEMLNGEGISDASILCNLVGGGGGAGSRAGASRGGRGAEGQPRQHGPGPAGNGNDVLWRFRHLLLRPLSNAGAVFQAHLSRILTCSWVGTGGSAGDEGRRKLLREYAKKAIPLDSVLLVTLSAHTSSYRANAFFAMSMAACLLAFFADLLSAVLLINSTDFAVELHCLLSCVSSFSMMLVPYLLLVSFNKLSAYAVFAVPLPVATALLHRACSGARAVPVIADTLDHIFDLSSAVNNIAAGGGLTGTIFGYAVSSKQSDIPAGPLGFLLFYTIFLAIYLMLVTTLRPPVLTRHAEPLSHVLLLLLAVSAVTAAVEFLGWLACTAFSIDVVEGAMYAAFVLVHGAGKEVVDASRRKEQRLLSAADAVVLFTMLMKLHSRHAPEAGMDGLRLSEILSMLLYLAAFLWSLNRMVFLHVAPATGGGAEAAGVWAWVWSAVELLRALVVMLAILDVIYNLGVSASALG